MGLHVCKIWWVWVWVRFILFVCVCTCLFKILFTSRWVCFYSTAVSCKLFLFFWELLSAGDLVPTDSWQATSMSLSIPRSKQRTMLGALAFTKCSYFNLNRRWWNRSSFKLLQQLGLTLSKFGRFWTCRNLF